MYSKMRRGKNQKKSQKKFQTGHVFVQFSSIDYMMIRAPYQPQHRFTWVVREVYLGQGEQQEDHRSGASGTGGRGPLVVDDSVVYLLDTRMCCTRVNMITKDIKDKLLETTRQEWKCDDDGDLSTHSEGEEGPSETGGLSLSMLRPSGESGSHQLKDTSCSSWLPHFRRCRDPSRLCLFYSRTLLNDTKLFYERRRTKTWGNWSLSHTRWIKKT